MIQTQLKARFSHFLTLDVSPLKNASRACALHIVVEASLEKSCAHENTKMRFYERGSCDIEFGIFTVERTEKENQFSVVLSTEKNNTLNYFQSCKLQCLIFSSIPLALIFTIKANQHCQYTPLEPSSPKLSMLAFRELLCSALVSGLKRNLWMRAQMI